MAISFTVSKSVPKTAGVHVIFVVSPSNESSATGSKSKTSRSKKSAKGAPSKDASSSATEKKSQQLKAALASLSNRSLSQASEILEAKGFSGKAKEAELVTDDSGQLTAIVGLGSKPSLNDVRDGAAVLARLLSKHSAIACCPLEGKTSDEFASICGFELTDWAKALAEGIVLGSYQFNSFKSKAEAGKLSKITVVTQQQAAAVRRNLAAGKHVGQAVCLARDLVNEPGGSLTPERFANKAKKTANQCGLKATVWSLDDIKRQKLGGLLGVNRGSERPARFVKLQWNPPSKPKKSLALVGKGVTFDSGGLSLKTAVGLKNMKYDMSGAAAVLGAMSAVAELKPACRVTAYLPLTDNMTGGDATRTGDVLTIRNKKTVEVLNTDAEGRLILADALSLACEDSPDAIVDLATLTGACVMALGNGYAGIMGNNQAWIDTVQQAAERAGERLWQLPLPEDYRTQLDSGVADLANIGSGSGGAITAGLFLSEFVNSDIAWAHLDIAGTAFADKPAGVNSKGGTGFGVRTLVELIKNF